MNIIKNKTVTLILMYKAMGIEWETIARIVGKPVSECQKLWEDNKGGFGGRPGF